MSAGQLRRHEIGKVTALTNPLSGHGAAVKAAHGAIARLKHRGVDVVEIVGGDAHDARHLLAAAVAKGTDAVMVTGGDGVVSNALQVLAGTDIPLGIIPAGTGNDHAREFGLPTKNPKAAADIVVDGWTETIDLGRIQDDNGIEKWFGTVAATGFDSLVNDRANRMRWPHGRMRYYIAMLAELSRLRPLPSMGGTSRKRMDDQHSPECGDNGVAGKDCHPTDAGGRPGPEKRSRRDKQQLPEQRRERYPDHNSDRGRCAQRARQRHGYCGEVHERGRVDRR